eukprot:gene13589-14882_t
MPNFRCVAAAAAAADARRREGGPVVVPAWFEKFEDCKEKKARKRRCSAGEFDATLFQDRCRNGLGRADVSL